MQNVSGYFDWAATAPADEDIIREATELSLTYFANPSSVHRAGIEAKKKLTEARERAAAVLGVRPDTVFFTSGGTEADHIPLLALLQRPSPATVLISEIEHPAIREQAQMLTRCGWNVRTVKPDNRGIVTAQAVAGALTDDTVLVCIMAVNNETGAVQPVYRIADVMAARAAETGKRRAKLHVDCVQAAGKIPFNVSYKGIDSAAFSAHKIGGPRGIGALYLAQRLEPFLRGGGQEQGIRSGTENLAGAWALSRCLERYYLCEPGTSGAKRPENAAALERYDAQCEYTSAFVTALSAIPGCSIVPECRKRKPAGGTENDGCYSPWVVQASFKNVPGEVMVRALAEKDFYISTGSACSARKMSRPILEAMGVPKAQAANAVRFSFGTRTRQADMDALVDAAAEIVRRFAK